MSKWINCIAILLQILSCTTSGAVQPSQQEVQSLANSISANDSAAVLELLRHNTNLCNSVVWWSRRPLHVAVAKGWDEVVDFLLKNGADINAEGDTWDTSNYHSTPLEISVKYNHPSIMKRLLDAHANPNHVRQPDGSALEIAFIYHHEEMAELLLENGANPFLQDSSYWKRTPVEMAITQSDGKLVPEMLKSARVKNEAKAEFLAEHGPALLAAAVQRGELEAVKALLAAGVTTKENPQDLTLLQTLSRSYAEARDSKDFDAERWAKIRELLQKHGCKEDAFSATGFGDLEAAQKIFAANANIVQAKDNQGECLLHWSVLTDQLPLTDFWLESGASPAATNSAGQTPLHLAAARGLTNQLARLLAANAPTDVKDTNGLTALDVAVQAKQTEAVRLLLAKNPPGASSKFGISIPLHQAAAAGDIHTLTNALQITTNLEARDELGFAPFQIAMKRGHLLAASLLLEAGADVNARDAKGNSTLQLILLEPPPYISDRPSFRWYARVHQDEQLKYLYPYLVDTGYSSSSALLEATVFLLANKASVSGTNDAGQSVIELVTSDSARIFPDDREKLLQLFGRQSNSSGHDNLNERDANGDTALHRAARSYDAEAAGQLIAAGADVNATNNLGRTPLHAAVEKIYGWPGPLNELLKAGANVNAQDIQGLTPLHVLALSDTSFRKEATRALLEAGANPNARDKHGRTPLMLFLSGKWPWSEAGDCISELLEAGADPSLTDDEGKNSFHYLAALGSQSPMFFIQKIGDTLLAAKVDVQARDNAGDTPLHIAAKTGTKDVFDWLVQHGASLDATNNAGETPHQLALHSTNQFSPLRFNSDLDIFQAISEGKLESVAAILKSEPERLNQTNQFGATPLCVAALNNRTNIVEFLAQHGAQWDAVSAVIANRAEILHDILARQPSDITNQFYGGSLLHLAAEHGAGSAAEMLIAMGADLKIQNTWGLSPLGTALLGHQTNVANLFLKHGAVENIFDAVYLDDSATVATLLNQNKSLACAMTRPHLTLTEISAATGHDKILKLLLDNGAPLGSTNGTTPLHAAAIYNRTHAVNLLIRRGANMEAFDRQGFTPLHLAVIQGSTETVVLLLKHGWFKRGADPNARTILPSGTPTRPMPMRSRFGMFAGNTALHFAAMNAQTNIIELLLKSGASVNATNAAGMTALDFASRGNFAPPISFWIGRNFMFGPPNVFHAAHNNPPISPSARQAAIDLLEKVGGKHGVYFPQSQMPGGFF